MVNLRKYATIILILDCFSGATAQNVIPQPKRMEAADGPCRPVTSVIYRASDDERSGYYTLSVKNGRALITGNRQYAMETMRQLGDSVPDIYIEDWAVFPIRGFMYDAGRNFRPVEMIMEDLEFIASYKLNVFHFHLTDNPAWRIECRCHPELNDPAFQRKGRDEGKFYTYSDLHRLVAFARELGITVIPEIDMPGHSRYFTDTFGFTMDSPRGRRMLEELLEEFFTEMTAEECPYFHIGSDEIHIDDRKGFMEWAENTVRRYGRRTIAWDPGLPADSSTIRQIWSETVAKKGQSGLFLDSWMGYLNYYDPIGFVQRAFLHSTSPGSMGGILCLWNDVRAEDKSRICPHNGMETGVMAFAERMWKGGGTACNPDILPPPEDSAGMELAEFERRVSHHRDRLVKGRTIRWASNSTIPWKISINGSDPICAWGGAVNMDAVSGSAGFKGDSAECTARTWIHAENDTVITAMAGFEAAARSNRISGGIGAQGKFENRGRIWADTTEVFPGQQWEEPGKYRFEFNTWHLPEEELPYTDEQFYWMRKPVKVPLHRGWNMITLSAPKTFSGQRWNFAFIPISLQPDGSISEASGIEYR